MYKTIIIIFIFCLTEIQCINYNWKWTITVHDKQPDTHAVIILSLPHAPDQGSIFLDEFVGGRNYSSSQSMDVNNTIDSVKVKAHYVLVKNGTCPPAKGAKSLKLDRIYIRYTVVDKNSKHSPTSYEKHFSNIELPLLCESSDSKNSNSSKTVELKNFKKLPPEETDCYVNNRYYEQGEQFDPDCSSSCGCKSGTILCRSLCPPYQADWSKCHRVKAYQQCCTKAECKDDLKDQQCDTLDVNDRFRVPWAVGLFTSNDVKPVSNNTVCAGAIIDKNWILTRASCVQSVEKTRIVHPISLAESVNITEIVLDNVDNETAKAHLALVKVEPKITFTNTIHEVNFPLHGECRTYANSTCHYYLTSFSGVTNGYFGMLLANRTDAGRCSSRKGARPMTCLQIDRYPQCPNLEGGVVTVQRSNKFYAVGFLLETGKKYVDGCDINRSQYRSMISLCHRFDWIKNVTSVED